MYFVNLSIITRIKSNLFFIIKSSDFSNFVIKFIIIKSYNLSGTLINLIYLYNKYFNYFVLLINNIVKDIYCDTFFKFKEGVIFSDKFNYFNNI